MGSCSQAGKFIGPKAKGVTMGKDGVGEGERKWRDKRRGRGEKPKCLDSIGRSLWRKGTPAPRLRVRTG